MFTAPIEDLGAFLNSLANEPTIVFARPYTSDLKPTPALQAELNNPQVSEIKVDVVVHDWTSGSEERQLCEDIEELMGGDADYLLRSRLVSRVRDKLQRP